MKLMRARRGFTLLECLIVVILLGIAVPVTAMFLDQRAAQRVDAIQALRASTLAQSVLEHVIADSSSNSAGRGYAAFANSATYLSDPATGLYTRIEPMLDFYEDLGVTCGVTISGEVSISGTATGNAANDLFRIVTVEVSATSATGNPIDVSVSALVTNL